MNFTHEELMPEMLYVPLEKSNLGLYIGNYELYVLCYLLSTVLRILKSMHKKAEALWCTMKDLTLKYILNNPSFVTIHHLY